jgi:hypothetical protein
VASEVGSRVADPARVAAAVAAATRQTAHPASVHWRDHAVGQGHAGLALLFGALDRHDPGRGWDRTAHRHLALAARAIEGVGRPPAGLSAGLAGLGLVASCLAGDGARYRRLLATLDQALVARVPVLVAGLGGADQAWPAGGSVRPAGAVARPASESARRAGRMARAAGDRLAPGLAARVVGWRSGTST